jgi:hypothetical protein
VGDEGDWNRIHVSDPYLFDWISDVSGKVVLGKSSSILILTTQMPVVAQVTCAASFPTKVRFLCDVDFVRSKGDRGGSVSQNDCRGQNK